MPATVSCGNSPAPGISEPSRAAVAAAQELIAAAHGEHRDSALVGGPERVRLAREIGRDERLLAILAASDVEKIAGLRIERIAETHRANLELVAAQSSAPGKDRDVAAIGVDVEVVGVQMRDPDPHATRSSQYGRTAPRSSSVLRSASIAV